MYTDTHTCLILPVNRCSPTHSSIYGTLAFASLSTGCTPHLTLPTYCTSLADPQPSLPITNAMQLHLTCHYNCTLEHVPKSYRRIFKINLTNFNNLTHRHVTSEYTFTSEFTF